MFLMSDSYQFLHNMRKNVDLFLSRLKNFLRRVLNQLLLKTAFATSFHGEKKHVDFDRPIHFRKEKILSTDLPT